VKGVYMNSKILCEKIWQDVKVLSRIDDLLPITIYSRLDAVNNSTATINNSTSDNSLFIWYQLFFQAIIQLQQNEPKKSTTKTTTMDELLNVCKEYYRGNSTERKLIDEFSDDYMASNVLWWWTRETFLSRVFTKSLLTLNIDLLYLYQFLINDMQNQMLKQYQLQFLNNQNTTKQKNINTLDQTYYRGQAVSNEKLTKIKGSVGELLSINNYLPTTKHRSRALNTVKKGLQPTTSQHRVFFEIKVDPSSQRSSSSTIKKPYCDISQLAHPSKDDNEILFSCGTIFRINSIDYDYDNELWIIKLTYYDEKSNSDFSQLFTYMQDELTKYKTKKLSYFVTLGNLSRKICSPSSTNEHTAEKYYKRLLSETSTGDNLTIAECYRGLGLIEYGKNENETALNHFEKALDLLPKSHTDRATLFNSIGLIHSKEAKYDLALTNFKKALEILVKNGNSSSDADIASSYNNIALTHYNKGEVDAELKNYQKALDIRSKILPANHPDIATLYSNIGTAYSDKNDYKQALDNLRLALNIRTKTLPPNHYDIAANYNNIGTVNSRNGEYQIALEYFYKALDIFKLTLPKTHPSIKQTEQNIKIVNDKIR
ncbi:unnamed protein product, partial [Didymodactylos carnosus]